MIRTDEALLSRGNISTFKTIYVEGKLDRLLIEDYVKQTNGIDINVISINDFIDDTEKPVEERVTAKQKIINLIESSNNDLTIDKNYIGIIDLDYDCILGKRNLNNLIYTDMNSVESYFIDSDLFNKIYIDHYCSGCVTNDQLKIYKENFSDFSKLFFYQISHFNEMDREEVLDFNEVALSPNVPWIDSESYSINIFTLIKTKTKISEERLNNITQFLDCPQMKVLEKDNMQFLHGKYLLKYIISVIKDNSEKFQKLNEITILSLLKNYFIFLNKYEKFEMFRQINQFAEAI